MHLIETLRIEVQELRDEARRHAGTGAIYAAGEAARAAAGLNGLIARLETMPDWQARQATEDHAYWLGLEEPRSLAAEW